MRGRIKLIPIGTIVRLGKGNAKARIVEYGFDEHSFDGWYYKMSWVETDYSGTFSWPRHSSSPNTQIRQLHPLEQLGMQAE